MRHYQTLDSVSFNTESGIYSISAANAHVDAKIALRREGEYVAISASYGPLEIALRPRYDALVRTLARLRPIGGLQTSRELGSSQAYVSVGIQGDGTLLLRPTIVGDASGHVGLNFSITDAARQELYTWLGVTVE
jgi:hypothetical protein